MYLKLQFPHRNEKMPACKDSNTFSSSGTSSFVKKAVGFLLGKTFYVTRGGQAVKSHEKISSIVAVLKPG